MKENSKKLNLEYIFYYRNIYIVFRIKLTMGSVKDLQILKEPVENEGGYGRFIFSDRYSVFDWGEMPDHIPHKGEALCLIGAYLFEQASGKGIRTHYGGVVADDRVLLTSELEKPSNTMEIRLVRVIHPKFNNGKYDYSGFTPKLKNFLIPLEVIYRNGLPEGSSIFKRLENRETSLEELGLDHYPKPGERLRIPIFDASTKLEGKDRYASWNEAKSIAGLEDKDVWEIRGTLLDIDNLITEISGKAGLTNEDGKIELAYDSYGKLILVDVIGTLDECRFTYNGINVSKEIARQFYKKTEWYKDLQEAKKIAEEKGILDWKNLCKSKPINLDPELKKIIEWMYTSTANAFLEREIFDSPKLEEVVEKYRKWRNNN